MKAVRTERRFAIVAALAVLCICEGLATLFFATLGHRFPFPDPERYVATAGAIESSRKYYDRGLGWTIATYDTPYGERPRQAEYDLPLISAYGDSATHGDEVDHGSTWCSQLARLVAADVYNFGVGAYGLDQALLRFERVSRDLVTPITLFAFISVDIDRNVSVYRKFHRPDGNFALTKPRFVLAEGGGLELRANPVPSAKRLIDVADPEFIRALGQHDHWYSPHGLPSLSFPRLAVFLSPAFWRFVVGDPAVDLWAAPGEARDLALRILDRFHAVAVERGTRPVVVHLPMVKESLDLAADGTWPSAVEVLREHCNAHGYECLTPIETLRGLAPAQIGRLHTRGVEGGHYSPAGNLWVARYLAERLQPGTEGLAALDEVAPAGTDALGDQVADLVDP